MRLYVPIKFNSITLITGPGTKPVNKQDGTCNIPKDADLRLLIYPPYYCA